VCHRRVARSWSCQQGYSVLPRVFASGLPTLSRARTGTKPVSGDGAHDLSVMPSTWWPINDVHTEMCFDSGVVKSTSTAPSREILHQSDHIGSASACSCLWSRCSYTLASSPLIRGVHTRRMGRLDTARKRGPKAPSHDGCRPLTGSQNTSRRRVTGDRSSIAPWDWTSAVSRLRTSIGFDSRPGRPTRGSGY
jgi:hypothetical protein